MSIKAKQCLPALLSLKTAGRPQKWAGFAVRSRSTGFLGLVVALLAAVIMVAVIPNAWAATFNVPVGIWPFDPYPNPPVSGIITVAGPIPPPGTALTVTVDGLPGNPGGPPPGGIFELGKYISITATPQPGCNLVSCTFRIYYTDAEVLAAGLNEATLQIYRWTGTVWEPLATNMGTDLHGEYLETTVTSFSNFAPMGPKKAVGGFIQRANILQILAPYLALIGLVATVPIVCAAKRLRH